jgi:hypothetical protein
MKKAMCMFAVFFGVLCAVSAQSPVALTWEEVKVGTPSFERFRMRYNNGMLFIATDTSDGDFGDTVYSKDPARRVYRARKFATMPFPKGVRIDSGWNCNPYTA